jgi:LmbE family N-acetylglucosaminyl deacetylase
VLDRRSFLLAGAAPALLAIERSAKPLKVVCVGGHPDDPESGCGGTLARYGAEGHKVTIVYLTRGERGIPGKSLEEAASIRSAEAEAACRILGATPRFAGQIDGDTEVNAARIQSFAALMRAEAPDVVFAQWPIDTHPDHQAGSMLAMRAYFSSNPKFVLYFYEVNGGFQSLGFNPTHFVDITAVREKKKAALFAHKSQDGERVYREHHEIMENYRGREGGVHAAEAFVRLARDGKIDLLPGL